PRPTTRPAACRLSPVPYPSLCPPSAHRFSAESISFDLLVQIRARHVECPRCLRDVPVHLAQLGEEKRPLRGVLEFLERLALEKRSQPRLLGIALADEPRDVLSGDARARGENEQTLNGVAQLADVTRPIE